MRTLVASAEHAVNAWASRLSEHSGLFLSDWQALELDQVLGYPASGALEWLFLDTDMELHRQNMMSSPKSPCANAIQRCAGG